MEHKYFDVIDDIRHPECMMECSWWLKQNPCSLFRTKKDQTHLQEFFIFIYLMQPFRGCLAELHHLFSICDCQACHQKPLYMLYGQYLARFAGTSWTWQNKALQWIQIRSWKQQEVEVPWRDGGKPPRLILAMKVHAPFFKPVLLAGV